MAQLYQKELAIPNRGRPLKFSGPNANAVNLVGKDGGGNELFRTEIGEQ